MYYIVSLAHTYPTEKYICLWGANNAGYCWSKQMAGLYESPIDGYHNSEGNMPIKQELAESLFMWVDYHGEQKQMIPNEPKYWNALGVKMSKRQHGLVRDLRLKP